MACFGIVCYGEGEEGCAGGGTQFPDGFIGVGVETAAFIGSQGWIFDPESEFAVGADGGEEVGVDGWGEPLYLFFDQPLSLTKCGSMIMIGVRHTCNISAV